MRHAPESDGGPLITGVRDEPVYPFGKLLRRTKIDELPQLFNVLRGDMAIGGPEAGRPSDRPPALLLDRSRDARRAARPRESGKPLPVHRRRHAVDRR